MHIWFWVYKYVLNIHLSTHLTMALQYPPSYSSLPRLIIILCFFIILYFPFCSTLSSFHVSSTSAFASTTSLIIEQEKEALALLTWKSSLHIRSQSFLSSWSRASPCNHWFGVTFHKSKSVSSLNLESCSVRGTLYNLNFLSPISSLLIFITTRSM